VERLSLGPPGPGRTLAVAYAVFAFAAGARSAAQIATDFGAAPLPYSLSALAAAVYCIAALTVNGTRRRLARAALRFELAGVITVGAAGLIDPGAFPDQTVWSSFGAGYLFLPLAMPIVGLRFLRRHG
jgi:hypothetical protein